MTERSASRTALMVAAYRARASKRPDRIMHDPWAEALAGPEGEAIATSVDAFMPDRELWIAVRTAYLDHHVARWIERAGGPTQVVVLGAGLDARAARFARPGVRFFEVDQPASQRDKLDRIARVDGYPVGAATYVTCDFERDDFLDCLAASGFDASAPALVLWEGVTPYLEEAAVRATLRRIATGLEPRSTVFFDIFTRNFIEGASRPEADKKAREFVESLGERFRWGTNDVLPLLFEEGFRHVRSVSFDEACLTLTGTYERSRQFRFQRIVRASRARPT